MTPPLANSFPPAGVWMLSFMAAVGLLALLAAPFIRRRRRRRDRERLHRQAEKARADILADGIIEGPKGPYIPHPPRRTWANTRTDTRPPKQTSYHGGPWP